MVQRAQMVMIIGSGLEALGSIPYKCMYIILFYFTIQFYFNFPFNYTYSLDAQSKTLQRYIHFTFVTLTVKSITKLAGMTRPSSGTGNMARAGDVRSGDPAARRVEYGLREKLAFGSMLG